MKRLLACVSLVAVTTTAAPAAVAPPVKTKPALVQKHVPAPPVRVAPADEYFGKLKMSVLGIRNTIKDVGANIEIDQTRWTQQASKAAFAEDAIRDWEKKYPQDTWLAKTVFALERMYAKLDSGEGRRRSLASMTWLVHDFPKSWYGKAGKREIAQGKVGHPIDTAVDPAVPNATPAQIAAPNVLPSPAPGSGAAASSGVVAPQVPAGIGPSAAPYPMPSGTP